MSQGESGDMSRESMVEMESRGLLWCDAEDAEDDFSLTGGMLVPLVLAVAALGGATMPRGTTGGIGFPAP